MEGLLLLFTCPSICQYWAVSCQQKVDVTYLHQAMKWKMHCWLTKDTKGLRKKNNKHVQNNRLMTRFLNTEASRQRCEANVFFSFVLITYHSLFKWAYLWLVTNYTTFSKQTTSGYSTAMPFSIHGILFQPSNIPRCHSDTDNVG